MFIPGYGKKSIFSFFRRRPRRPRLFRWKPPSRRLHGGVRLLGSTMADLVGVLTVFMLPLYILSAAGRTAKRRYRRRRLRAAGKRSAAKTNGGTAAKAAAPKSAPPPDRKEKPYAAPEKPHRAEPMANTGGTDGGKTPKAAKPDISQRTETTPLRYDPIYRAPVRTKPAEAKTTQEAPSEDVPKSTPKGAGDRYICKRMTIAGSSYCDGAVLAKLTVGTYFDLEAEPDNPYDKDAVSLRLDGEKLGYVPKADRMLYATSLKLNRRIYGVITGIDRTVHPVKYEFETWFAGVR